MKKVVSYLRDVQGQLSSAEEAEVSALIAKPESEIDTSDIPEWTAEQWKKAVRGGMYRPVKMQVTARIDADVLEWLKSQGDGYQTRMNAILRREMLAAVRAGK